MLSLGRSLPRRVVWSATSSPFSTAASSASTLTCTQRHVATAAAKSAASRNHKRPKSDYLAALLGISIFPASVWWMLKDDNKVVALPEDTTDDASKTSGGLAPAFGKMSVDQVPKPQLGGPFKLTNAATGATVTDVDVFQGKWSLLYFGFSKCAEICPNTLKFIAELMAESDRMYGDASTNNREVVQESQRLQTVFLSIDYIRDTPAVVDAFVSKYEDPARLAQGNKGRRMIGLCGDRDSVENAAHQWRVYFSSYDESEEEKLAREEKGIPLPEMDDSYQFDHSSAIYLVGPDGKMKDFFFREIGVKNTVERLGLHFQDVYGINHQLLRCKTGYADDVDRLVRA